MTSGEPVTYSEQRATQRNLPHISIHRIIRDL